MEYDSKFVFSLYKMDQMFYSVYVCRFAMSSDGNRIRTGFFPVGAASIPVGPGKPTIS